MKTSVSLRTFMNDDRRPAHLVTVRYCKQKSASTGPGPARLDRPGGVIGFKTMDYQSFLKNLIAMRIFATPFHHEKPRRLAATCTCQAAAL